MIAAWLPAVSPITGVATTHLGFVTEGSTVHMLYRDSTTAKYIRSTDEGGTFSAPVDVATLIDEVPLTQCIASNGATVHAVYARDVDDGSLPPKLYYKRSTDSGASWGSEVTFDDGTALANNSKFRVSMVADGNYVHCFWSGDVTKLWQRTSTDNGVTWGAKTEVVSGSTTERPEAQLDGTFVHLTWTDRRNGSTSNGGEVYYNRSADRGVTWGTDQRITTTASQDTARPSVASNGPQVVLAWQWPIFSENILYTHSTDNGATWATEAALTTGGGFEHAGLEYANEVVALCYTNNSSDITFTRLSRDNAVTWETAQQPYAPAAATAAPLVQFTTRFLLMVDRQTGSGGTKLVRSPVFESEPSSAALRDDFNRADDASPPPGANWTNGVTTFTAGDGIAVGSNAACRRSSGGFRQGGYWNANNFTNVDLVAEVSGWADTNGNGFAIYTRLVQIASGTTDGYTVDISRGAANTTWNLQRITNGSGTNLSPVVNRTLVANDKVCQSSRGDLQIMWHQPGGSGEWTQVAAAVDTTYSSAGRVGLAFLANQVTRVTNLWATEVRTLVVEPGEYSVSGSAATLDKTFGLVASPGIYTVSGVAATLAATGSIVASPGTYTVTGTSATLAKGSVLPADTPFYTVAGTDASLVSGRAVNAAPAAYTVTGAAAQLVFTTAGAFLIDAQDGTYTVTGADANLVLTLLYMDAQPGAFTVTGENATLDPDTQGEVLYEAGEQGQIADYGRGRIRELVGRLS